MQCVRRKVSVGSLHNTQQNFPSVPGGGGEEGGGPAHRTCTEATPSSVLPALLLFPGHTV